MMRSLVLSLAVAVVGTTGCQPKRNYPSSNYPVEAYFTHEVRYQGETMGLIANWYTGSTDNYTILASENPSIDLNRMRIGDRIRIPERMLIRREELPNRVVKSAPKNDSKPSDGAVAPTLERLRDSSKEETPLADQAARERGDLLLDDQQVVPGQADAAAVLPVGTVAPEVVAVPPAFTPSANDAARRDVRIKTRDELLEELLK
jgi:hypothetical protein